MNLAPDTPSAPEGGLFGSVKRSRTTILVFVAMWSIGLAALAAVISLQTRVDTERQAQVVVGTMQRQVGDLAQVAFSAAVAAHGAGPTQAQTTLQLQAGKQAIRASLATLAALGDTTEWARLRTLDSRYFPEISRIAALVEKGGSRPAALEFGRDEQPGGRYGALLGELRRAGASYSGNAARARVIGEIGTLTAILFMLLAFSLTLYRATRLAHEKQQLLAKSQVEALNDALTGLPNRRSLFADMDALLRQSSPPRDLALGMFDLNGFKKYNDTFGHPAGDALLARLGRKLAATLDGRGTAYRIGGDEFCVITRGTEHEQVFAAASEALSEHGERFEVSCAHGNILIVPGETTLEQALQEADQRLYNNKRSSRTGEDVGVHDVLLQVIAENSPALADHLSNVGRLGEAVARELNLSPDDITLTRLVADLHDVGKTAIPNAILDKPGPLDDEEWAFIKRHTIIGERILAAAPALARVAPLVRATHERLDGSGYPDGLRGNQIPLISRIVNVVDAYDAMTSGKRPYSHPLSRDNAIAELRRCTGTQFDPAVTEAVIAIIRQKHPKGTPTPSRREAPFREDIAPVTLTQSGPRAF